MKTVRTAARILTLLSAESPTVTVSRASNELGLTMSGASRLLAALASSGIVEQTPDRSYRPGPLAYRLGLLYHSHNRLADLVHQGARAVVDATGYTCWVSVLSGTEVMLISRVPGQYDQGFHVDAGNALPANASAGGKALLARLMPEEVTTLFSSTQLPARTVRTKTERDSLLADLAVVRRRGWSVIVEELFDDVASVGVALRGAGEPTPMALSVSLPSFHRTPEKIASVVQPLVRIAREIAAKVNDAFWLQVDPASANVDEILDELADYGVT